MARHVRVIPPRESWRYYSQMLEVSLTVDVEPDCPPFLWTWRGVDEGLPLLLDLFSARGIPATFFTTGASARHAPDQVSRMVSEGHELGCHGMSHRSFFHMTEREAEEEIATATGVLRDFGPVTAFRAPNLRFPDEFLPLLGRHGFLVDSSRAHYKPLHWLPSSPTGLRRMPVSITSSLLRLPQRPREFLLGRLRGPVVLFVHPWEFVDLRDAPIRWDCRAGTGERALRCLEEVIDFYERLGARFARISDLTGGSTAS